MKLFSLQKSDSGLLSISRAVNSRLVSVWCRNARLCAATGRKTSTWHKLQHYAINRRWKQEQVWYHWCISALYQYLLNLLIYCIDITSDFICDLLVTFKCHCERFSYKPLPTQKHPGLHLFIKTFLWSYPILVYFWIIFSFQAFV